MNIGYLKEVIIPQRKKEIEEGKNAGTRQPIYVVMDLRKHFSEGHDCMDNSTNLKEKFPMFGYVDLDVKPEDRQIKETDAEMENPVEITEFYTDRPVAFFLTSKAAHEYLEYQKHNLSKEAYVYVFCSGYRNAEMDELLNGE